MYATFTKMEFIGQDKKEAGKKWLLLKYAFMVLLKQNKKLKYA